MEERYMSNEPHKHNPFSDDPTDDFFIPAIAGLLAASDDLSRRISRIEKALRAMTLAAIANDLLSVPQERPHRKPGDNGSSTG